VPGVSGAGCQVVAVDAAGHRPLVAGPRLDAAG
jgi:hypothetical protein